MILQLARTRRYVMMMMMSTKIKGALTEFTATRKIAILNSFGFINLIVQPVVLLRANGSLDVLLLLWWSGFAR